LQRQAHDPQKDQQKATQVVPLWQAYVARRAELLAKGRTSAELDEMHWLLEELRVHVFAPELKTAVPVSPARVQDRWSTLAR
jgi:ATP-dependent helicase HrpA